MIEEEVQSLLELITENLPKIKVQHSNLLDQVQLLKNRQLFGKEEILQEAITQLLEQEKLLKELCEQRQAIQLVEQTSLPWSVKKSIIIPLLSEYGWSENNKIEFIFQQWDYRLLKLEKKLADLSYFCFDSANLKSIIDDNFLAEFV